MNFTFHGKKYKLIMLGISGSRLYGTNTDSSDYDYRGVFIANYKDKLGIDSVPEQIESSNELKKILQFDTGIALADYDDIVLYELKKFVKLAAGNNPNIFDILFMPFSKCIYYTKEWEKIVENKHLFLSKKIKHTFLGYAHSQLHRMKTFKGKDSNSKRAKVIEKFGYDTKNAMHLIRLLFAAISILKTGEYNPIFSKCDRKFLINVKNGWYNYEKIKKLADDLEKICNELYETSDLQDKPNIKEINELLIKLSL